MLSIGSSPKDRKRLPTRTTHTGHVTSSASGSLAVSLHAINGPWLNAKIARPEGRLHRMLDEGRSDAEIITVFYRVALGREPGGDERAHWKGAMATAGLEGRTAAFEDFVWALLGSAEFTHNH